MREVLTGYPVRSSGGGRVPASRVREYRPGQPLKARYRAKAEELGSHQRTVERWVAAYRRPVRRAWLDTGAARPGHGGGSPLG